jgi:hypothetical protein
VCVDLFVYLFGIILLLDRRASIDGASKSSQQLRSLIDLEAETKKSLQYVKSIKNTKRQLVFVHIPKAAGTTIEGVGGLQAKLSWGSCRFNHRPRRPGGVCLYPP